MSGRKLSAPLKQLRCIARELRLAKVGIILVKEFFIGLASVWKLIDW